MTSQESDQLHTLLLSHFISLEAEDALLLSDHS